jgi:hypothetical protein
MKPNKPKNPNDHKRATPSTKGEQGNDRKFTAYNTKKEETSTPQKVREKRESASEHKRSKDSGE